MSGPEGSSKKQMRVTFLDRECGWRDSNSQKTCPSSMRVYQFHHIRIIIDQKQRSKTIMTPSLAAFFWSLIWAAVLVILPITGAIIWVSQQDKLRR
jgi:photosystem II PsbX protein